VKGRFYSSALCWSGGGNSAAFGGDPLLRSIARSSAAAKTTLVEMTNGNSGELWLLIRQQLFCCPELLRRQPDFAAKLHLKRLLRGAAFGLSLTQSPTTAQSSPLSFKYES